MVRIMEWAVFGYLAVMALIYFPGISSLLMLLTALLALPVERVQRLYLKIFFRRWIQVVLALLIFIAALVYAPAAPATEPNEYRGEIQTQNEAPGRDGIDELFR